ncbi:transposase, partial [Alteromonas ponticola]|nr:transposase [Alteromonas sp. ASW11-130]
LMDEAAIAACMAYVDLNPVRACLAKNPEESAHTSIQKRVNAAKLQRQPKRLLPFAGNPSNNMPDGLPFRFEDYLALVELSGRHFHPQKRGKIDDASPPILTRVGLDQANWNHLVAGIETEFQSVVSVEKLINLRDRNKGYNTA